MYLLQGTILKKYLELFIFENFVKKTKFSKPAANLREPYRNSQYIFSLDVKLVAPVKAKHALHWTELSFS